MKKLKLGKSFTIALLTWATQKPSARFWGSNSVRKYSQRKALIFIFIVAADRDRLMTGR